jgi:hypothetical protein
VSAAFFAAALRSVVVFIARIIAGCIQRLRRAYDERVAIMRSSTREAFRFLLSATPLFLIAAADSFFFAVLAPDERLPAAGYLVQAAILITAALVTVPSTVVRLTCTILLLIVALLASMTIGVFYFPAVGVAALLTMHQSKVDKRRVAE